MECSDTHLLWILNLINSSLSTQLSLSSLQSTIRWLLSPHANIILMNTTSFRKGSRARDSTRAQLPDLIPAYLSLKIRTLPQEHTS